MPRHEAARGSIARLDRAVARERRQVAIAPPARIVWRSRAAWAAVATQSKPSLSANFVAAA